SGPRSVRSPRTDRTRAAPRRWQPRTEGTKHLCHTHGPRLLEHVGRHPVRERHSVSDVTTGRRVLFVDSSDLLASEASCEQYQCMPQTAMAHLDLAIDQATDEHLLRVRDLGQNRENQAALGMRPPAALDGLSYDGFREPRRGSLRRSQNDTVLLDEGECLFERTDFHDSGSERGDFN